MNISLGIMAWNEAEVIGVSLASLLDQSLPARLAALNARLEIVVVPNGCTDATADVAAAALRRLAAPFPSDRLTWKVCNLPEPGKANAWNRYVHELSDPAADYLILMDADIRFTHPDTLWNMVQALERDPHAVIATDLPQKHVLFKERRGFIDRLSLAVGRMTQAAPGQLTGQLYVARAPVLRRIVLPPGLIVEDGYIKFMVCTGFFRQSSDDRRIVRAPDASHVFEAYTRPLDLFNNQRRQQIAHAIYVWLRDFLKARVGAQDAAEIARDLTGRDPEWFRTLIRERVTQGGWWVMYPGAFRVRFRRLRNLPPLKILSHLPAALAGFLFDVVVLVAANARLKRGELKGVWKDTKSHALAAAPAFVTRVDSAPAPRAPSGRESGGSA